MAGNTILRFRNCAILTALLAVVFAVSGLHAQVRFGAAPPSGVRQPLNIPPTVSGIPNHARPYMPNTPASVTSISPYNFNTPRYNNSYGYGGHGCRGYGCGYGYGGVAIPYYYVYPAYDAGYDTAGGGGGGPYLYSGPPQGQAVPSEQTLHVIVDTAPQKHAISDDELASAAPPRPAAAPPVQDARPGVSTTLVYRDGHKQEVTNYAIMGQTLYVFDNRTKKIALADLDIPATIKLNDDEGVEFQLPKAKEPSRPAKTSGVPLQSVPDDTPKTTSSMTATP